MVGGAGSTGSGRGHRRPLRARGVGVARGGARGGLEAGARGLVVASSGLGAGCMAWVRRVRER